MKVVIIAPHHDDETIGCGGSIFLHSQRGDEVIVIFIYSGWSAIPCMTSKEQASCLIQKEAAEACAVLGVSQIKELCISDRAFLTENESLCGLIRTLRETGGCDILYLPHQFEGDREHRIVNELTREALWLSSSDYLPEFGEKAKSPSLVLGYEVWTPLPNYMMVTDISSVIHFKKEALRKYSSQLGAKDWIAGCIGLNAYRGVISGKGTFAEAFQIIKVNSNLIWQER